MFFNNMQLSMCENQTLNFLQKKLDNQKPFRGKSCVTLFSTYPEVFYKIRGFFTSNIQLFVPANSVERSYSIKSKSVCQQLFKNILKFFIKLFFAFKFDICLPNSCSLVTNG